jgi:hypothetical protein
MNSKSVNQGNKRTIKNHQQLKKNTVHSAVIASLIIYFLQETFPHINIVGPICFIIFSINVLSTSNTVSKGFLNMVIEVSLSEFPVYYLTHEIINFPIG